MVVNISTYLSSTSNITSICISIHISSIFLFINFFYSFIIIFREELRLDLELYEFVKQRFQAQINNLNTKKKNIIDGKM